MAELGDIKRSIEQMPVGDIESIARMAVDNDSAVVESVWSVTPMSVLSAGNGTIGFFNVSGHVKVGEVRSPWSSVVKVLDPDDFSAGSSKMQSARNELDALQAPELGLMESGMRCVPVYGLLSSTDSVHWLWMKDLSGGISTPWDAETYVRVARDVGEFSALWPEESMPTGSWITTDPSASRIEQVVVGMPEYYKTLRENENHPHVLTLIEGRDLDNIFSLIDDASVAVKATRSLPRSVAHHDCHARNLFPWTDQNGHSMTYAVDWASTGLAPIGTDGGSLAGGGIAWTQAEADMIASNESAIFDSYVAGLIDSGWQGEVRDVRLAYLAQLSSYIVMLPFFVTLLLSEGGHGRNFQKRMGVDENTAVLQVTERIRMFRPLLDEAVDLAKQLE